MLVFALFRVIRAVGDVRRLCVDVREYNLAGSKMMFFAESDLIEASSNGTLPASAIFYFHRAACWFDLQLLEAGRAMGTQCRVSSHGAVSLRRHPACATRREQVVLGIFHFEANPDRGAQRE
ncbi:hypothetical protein KC338_g233 [Hortaea werneckii]|nr:hypothetical protein KC338_g233 [Hortaea werneckii]